MSACQSIAPESTVFRYGCQRHSVTESRLNAAMETIGSRVRSEREGKGMTRAQLAKAARISPTALSDLELGYTKSTPALHRIAEALGVRVQWLETGKGAKHPDSQDAPVEIVAGTVDAAAELRAVLALTVQALAESIPTVGAAIAEGIGELPDVLRGRPYLRGLLGTIRSQLAHQEALHAPMRSKRGSGARKRP